MKTPLIDTKWKQIKSLYLEISDSFKDGSSKLKNHSAMTVGKFILAHSDHLISFILKLLSLKFCIKKI